ncbi:MAG: carbon starvation protein A [Planctomycetota bacterium]|nr:MAG: carbon starvation protein A [Planctomycetota bacterium]
MNSIILAAIAFLGYILAYRFYGRFLSRKIFGLRDTTDVPSHQLEDGVDYVPTNRSILFGHHFTTIAGAGPIVGPAIGVIWGWLPAFIWIFLGPIFMGGIHDFGALVISARARGKSIADASADIVGARVRTLFVFVVFVLIWVVAAVFAFLISVLFRMYPACVFPIWVELPIAVWFAYMVHKRKVNFHVIAIIALALMYVTIFIGTRLPISFDTISGVEISHPERAQVEKAIADLKDGKSAEEVNKELAVKGGFAAERIYGVFDELAPRYATGKGLSLQASVTIDNTVEGDEIVAESFKNIDNRVISREITAKSFRDTDNNIVGGEIVAESFKNNVRKWIEIKKGDETYRFKPGKGIKLQVDKKKKRGIAMASAVTELQWDIMGIEKPVYRAFFYSNIHFLKLFGVSWLNSLTVWIIILFIYVYIASILPVQVLLQPRDYINSHELYLGLAIIVIGLVISAPAIVAPAVNIENAAGAPNWIPFMFVIVACGAISGFHAFASSGTTVKQLNNEKDALSIGYGSMLLEGALATVVIIACTAGFSSLAEWKLHYASWTAANGLGAKVGAFIWGSSKFAGVVGIPIPLAAAMISVIVVSFAATTLDSAMRIQRYIIGEIAGIVKVPVIGGKHPAAIIAVGSAAILAFIGGGSGGMILWPVFGAANQMLAGLVLLVITIYLIKRGVNSIYALVPMVFLIVITTWALIIKLLEFIRKIDSDEQVRYIILTITTIILLVLEIWMIIEAARAYVKGKKGLPPVEGGAGNGG